MPQKALDRVFLVSTGIMIIITGINHLLRGTRLVHSDVINSHLGI